MQLTEILSNPTRMRITQFTGTHNETTTKEIAAHLSDVPRRTLYRHINFLVEAGVLKVKEERRVRGGMERVLIDNQEEYISKMKLSDCTYQFFTNIYNQFARYEEKYGDKTSEQFDKDVLCYCTSTFVLDDNETNALLDEFVDVIKKYEKNHKEKYGNKMSGKVRSISFVSAPVDQD